MVVKAVENADGFVAYSRLHAKYYSRTVARIMRIHKECMYPSMECFAQGDEGPQRVRVLEDGGVLGVVSEGYQGSGLSSDR